MRFGDRAMIREILSMLRAAIIVGLTLGAVSTASVGAFLVHGSLWRYKGPSITGGGPTTTPWWCDIFFLENGVVYFDVVACQPYELEYCVGFPRSASDGLSRGSRFERFIGLNVFYPKGPSCEWGLSAYVSPRFLWVIACLLATYPAVTFMRGPLRRRRRRKRGLCVGCGYDLTGNITGVCPECGVPIDPKQDEATG